MQQLQAVYVVEFANHLCSVCSISNEEEERFKSESRNRGATWTQRLCTTKKDEKNDPEDLLLRHCSRLMIPLHHDLNVMGLHFLALDVAQKVLRVERPEWGWTPGQNYGPDIVLRFAPHEDPELIVHPYQFWDDRAIRRAMVDVFIQETMVRPICTVSVHEYDLRRSDGDWRERLGTVPAHRLTPDVVEVRLDDINNLVRQCSRPMVSISQCMPPLYVPREWLAVSVAKLTRVQ